MNPGAEFEEFQVTIDFVTGEGDARRVFDAMSGLIGAFESLDVHLLSTLDVSLQTRVVLDGIEPGSIRAKFRDLVEGIPDEALKDASWKKIVGHFLLRSKYAVLKWLEDKSEIGSREDVRVLEGELLAIAEETDIKRLPAYTSPRAEVILSDMRLLQESLARLRDGDRVTYTYGTSSVTLNRELRISTEVIREVLTKDLVSNSIERVIKVKKPDYLGQSMWEFQFERHSIEAKIEDGAWLRDFQNRSIDVKPGDSMRVMLFEEISYGYDGEVVDRHYEVRKVYEIIKPRIGRQGNIEF